MFLVLVICIIIDQIKKGIIRPHSSKNGFHSTHTRMKFGMLSYSSRVSLFEAHLTKPSAKTMPKMTIQAKIVNEMFLIKKLTAPEGLRSLYNLNAWQQDKQ